MGLLKEFREFAIKGNFIDLAVGVILGAASGDVVKALVDKVIMPPIGLITGRVNFSELQIVLQKGGPIGANGKANPAEVGIYYGAALQSFIQLVIIGFIVFMVVRLYNKFRNAATTEAPTVTRLAVRAAAPSPRCCWTSAGGGGTRTARTRESESVKIPAWRPKRDVFAWRSASSKSS